MHTYTSTQAQAHISEVLETAIHGEHVEMVHQP